jgi:hypothetical protein
MFEMLYLGTIVDALNKIPREYVAGAAVYCLANEIHKRHSNVKLEQAKSDALAAEVELMRLKIEFQKTIQDTNS